MKPIDLMDEKELTWKNGHEKPNNNHRDPCESAGKK